jgi:hypothetical protein
MGVMPTPRTTPEGPLSGALDEGVIDHGEPHIHGPFYYTGPLVYASRGGRHIKDAEMPTLVHGSEEINMWESVGHFFFRYVLSSPHCDGKGIVRKEDI